jgi:hypothetical protein
MFSETKGKRNTYLTGPFLRKLLEDLFNQNKKIRKWGFRKWGSNI